MASVRKRTWRCRDQRKSAWVADFFDAQGKRRQRTFPTRNAAETWLRAASADVLVRVPIDLRMLLSLHEQICARAQASGHSLNHEIEMLLDRALKTFG